MKLSKTEILRRISLVFFLFVTTILVFMHAKTSYFPSVDFICPFGGLETIYKFIATGSFISKTTVSNIVLLGITLFFGIFLGRVFCGWICAFGALQGGVRFIGSKIIKKKVEINPKLDKILRLLKYPILFIILYFTYKTGQLIIRPYDPWATYAHIFSPFSEIISDFLIGFIILLAILIASFFIDRPFCKYLCPLGAFLGILRIFNFNTIKRDEKTCISCKKCNMVCPMNIDVMTKEKVKSAECINCFQCINDCPTKKETLKLKTFGVKIKPIFAGSFIVIVFILLFVIGTFLPVKGLAIPILKESVTIKPINDQNASQKISIPAGFEIKGSMTINQIAKALNISNKEVKILFGIPLDAPDNIPLKEFIEDYGLSIKKLKDKLQK